MPQEWYVAKDGKQFGPITADRLRMLATADKIGPADLVWKKGLAEWAPAGTVKGLFANELPPPLPSTKILQPTTHSDLLHSIAPETAKLEEGKINDAPKRVDLLFVAKSVITVAAIAFFIWAVIQLHGLVLGIFSASITLLFLGGFVWACRRFLLLCRAELIFTSAAGWITFLSMILVVKLGLVLFGPVLLIVVALWATTRGPNEAIRSFRPITKWALIAVLFTLLVFTAQFEDWFNHVKAR